MLSKERQKLVRTESEKENLGGMSERGRGVY